MHTHAYVRTYTHASNIHYIIYYILRVSARVLEGVPDGCDCSGGVCLCGCIAIYSSLGFPACIDGNIILLSF